MVKDYLAEMEALDREECENDHIDSMKEFGYLVDSNSYWEPWNHGAKDISNFDLEKVIEQDSIDVGSPTGELREEYAIVGEQAVPGVEDGPIIQRSRLLDVVSANRRKDHYLNSTYASLEPIYFSSRPQNFNAAYYVEGLFPEVFHDPFKLMPFPGYGISNLIFRDYSFGWDNHYMVKESLDSCITDGMKFTSCIFDGCELHLSHPSILNSHFTNCDINIYLAYNTVNKLFSVPTKSRWLNILSLSTFNNCNINIINQYPYKKGYCSGWNEFIRKSDYTLRIDSNKFRNSKIYCDESLQGVFFDNCVMSHTIFDVRKPDNFHKGIKFTESNIDTFSLYARDDVNKIIDDYF